MAMARWNVIIVCALAICCTIIWCHDAVTFGLVLLQNVFVSGAAPEMSCKEFVASLTKRQLGGISGCSKSMKFKSPKEKSAKMTCILKCVLTKEGMLNSEGQFISAEEFERFIEGTIPVNLVEKAGPKFRHCRETTSQNLDHSDEFCKSYDPMLKCFLEAFGNLCK